ARRNPERAVAFALEELLRREHLAADDPIEIGDKAFHLADSAFFDPVGKALVHHTHIGVAGAGAPPFWRSVSAELSSNGRGAEQAERPRRAAGGPRPSAFAGRLRERIGHLMNHHGWAAEPKSSARRSSIRARRDAVFSCYSPAVGATSGHDCEPPERRRRLERNRLRRPAPEAGDRPYFAWARAFAPWPR